MKLWGRRKAPARPAQDVPAVANGKDWGGSVRINFAGLDVACLIDHPVKELAHGLG